MKDLYSGHYTGANGRLVSVCAAEFTEQGFTEYLEFLSFNGGSKFHIKKH